jgi:hypothetical protein
MRCPKCSSTSIRRVGNALTLLVRRLFRRNLYICYSCHAGWHSPIHDSTIPRAAGSVKRLKNGGHSKK